MASALETLNQLASSAAKAVWGDSNDAETHKEPISGATGDVSKGEPYDAGNLDPQAQSKVESSLKSEAAAAAAAPSELTDDQHYTFSSSKKDKGNLAAAATTATNEGVTEPRSTPTTAINPEEGKPLDELTGKGPRPVEVLAKENGGNAAAAAVAATETDSSASVPAAPESKLADAENKNSSTNDGNMREATEEEYVESSGLAADGGDFDVTKPGAGLEADRLMEQKGIKIDDADSKQDKNSNSNSNSNSGRKSSDSSRKDKPKLKERIKNKLHRH